jgi:hypothetical protein
VNGDGGVWVRSFSDTGQGGAKGFDVSARTARTADKMRNARVELYGGRIVCGYSCVQMGIFGSAVMGKRKMNWVVLR